MNRRDAMAAFGGVLVTSTAAHAVTDHPRQDMGPVQRFHLYLCAFHIAKKDPRFVIEAHHYCSPIADDVHQCVIFDRPGENARILGVEYIISDARYRKLPREEQKYYHPHSYEILSGQLVAPGMDPKEEDQLLGGLITSWGKTWHTWPNPSTELPMGEPLLMWSATRDGQIPEKALAARDRRLGISTPEIRNRRSVLGEVPQTSPPKSLDDLGRQFSDTDPDVPPARR